MIADEQPGGGHQLDIAAAEKAAPEQQKGRDKKCDARRERIEGRARIPRQRDPKSREREDRNDELVRNAASSDVAVGDDGEDADPEEKDQ